MKTRLLILAFVGFTLFITSIPYGESLRAIFELDEIIELSDVIVIGTVQSTWIDIRPFDDHKIVDTAKIKIDDWLKNEQNSDTIEIRYYGHWSQTIENILGIHRMDTPIHRYDAGQRILTSLSYEDSTMVMGEGYYPFYEGSFVINDDVAQLPTGKQIKLTELYDLIKNSVADVSIVEIEPETTNIECVPTDYEKTRKCLANYHCNVDEKPKLNEECIETYNGISIREMCSNPDNIIIQKSNGCMVLPLVDSKSCGQDFACPETP